jgi:hypothetical protein
MWSILQQNRLIKFAYSGISSLRNNLVLEQYYFIIIKEKLLIVYL